MLTVELSADDLENNGQFAKIGGVARAIAKAKGVSNLLNSERKIFPRINAGVQSGALNPIDPETLEPLSKSDYGIGLVHFDELAEWGRSTKQFDFRICAPASQKVGAGGTAPDEPKPAAIITRHRLKTRSNPLDAVIELATGTALAPDSNQSVWAELVKLAESKNKPAPLIGYSSDGIQYRGKKYEESGEPDIFKANNLRDRMARAKKR